MYFTNDEIEKILTMDYNPKYEYSNEDILFNKEMFIDNSLGDHNDYFYSMNANILQNELYYWKYDKEKFSWGRENKRLFPSLMIYLILATFKYQTFIPYHMYESVVVNRYKLCGGSLPYTDEQILVGRAYQTYASYLREVDACNKIQRVYPDAKIYKNPYLDICGGIDFKVDIKGELKYIAIKHQGHVSDKYDRMWKNDKEDKSIYDIIRLTAAHDKGDKIELVDIEDIQKLF